MVTVLKGDNWDGDQDGGHGDHNSCNIMMALVKVMVVVFLMTVVALCGSASNGYWGDEKQGV